MTEDSAKPVTLWRRLVNRNTYSEGWAFSRSRPLPEPGCPEPDEYRALPVADYEALRRRVEEVERAAEAAMTVVHKAFKQADLERERAEQAESRADAAEKERDELRAKIGGCDA